MADGFVFRLGPAAPNPFRSSTAISFSVARRSHVLIEVFNVLGQKVRTLVDEALEPNSYVRNWDGRSNNERRVSSGIYFYKMVAGDYSETKKAVVLR
jgi:flagellar hook assembly protein FlgD